MRHIACAFAIAGLVLVVTGPLGAPSPVRAQQPPSSLEQARVLFERGLELADEEQYGEALEHLRRSRAILERPSTVFNIGSVLVRLGRPTEAVVAFRDFLRISSPTQDAGARAQATQLMAAAAASIARLRLTVSPPNAEVRVDGVVVGGSGAVRSLELDPGRHSIQVSALGHTSRSFRVATLAGSRSERIVTLGAGTAERMGRIVISASVARASISVDSEPVGTGTAQLEVSPGRHRIDVTAQGYAPFRSSVDVAAGGQASVQASMEPLESGGSLFSSPIFWIITGAVLVGGGVGLGIAVGTSDGSDPGAGYGGTTGVILQGLDRRQ